MEKVIVVVGPTGVGKTRMGVALAKHFNGEVISGDSMQIYKTMDIGTAKVTDDEMEGIVHHLIDVKEPTESYSVKDFQDEVRLKIKEIISRGKLPIIVGGTGLYIKAALYDYEFIKVDGLNKPIVSDGTVVTYYYKNKNEEHTHNLTLVAAKAATCTTAGNSAYYTCDGCDKWFADATGSVEITDKTSVKIPAPGHTAGTEWKSDDTNHWHECSRCHDKKDEAAHDYGSDNVCDTCGYYKTVPHTHNLTLVAAKAATCTEGGKEAYYKCEGCGKFYEDVLGTKEITDLASWGNIAKIAHTTKQTVTKATPTANGMSRPPTNSGISAR